MKGLGPAWALFTVGSTLLGGLVGLRLRHRLTGIMAFTGGVVLGVALFDLAPEALDRLGSASAGRTGSVLTMDRTVRNLVDLGVPWPTSRCWTTV